MTGGAKAVAGCPLAAKELKNYKEKCISIKYVCCVWYYNIYKMLRYICYFCTKCKEDVKRHDISNMYLLSSNGKSMNGKKTAA